MRGHEQFAEALALYALGALDDGAGERAALEAHLRTCDACREELEALYGDVALLALSVAGPAPPARARIRLEESLGQQPRRGPTRRLIVGVLHPRWRAQAPMAACLLLAVFSLMLWREDSRLRGKLDRAQTELQSQGERLRSAQATADLLHAPDVEHITLVASKTRPQPHVKMMYAPAKGGLLLMASNLESLPPNKVYELWLMPANGGPPLPCGTFRPDTRGNAMMDHTMPSGTEAKAFAITIEPQGGSGQPTMPIVMDSAG